MERNAIRNSLTDRLDVEDLKYDIQVLTTELDTHKSKTKIFENTIQAQQADLDCLLGVPVESKKMGEIYK